MGLERPTVWLILAVVALALFGYKRLPDASRSVGRSLRIFKSEMKGMATDDEEREAAAAAAAPPPLVAPPAAPATPAPSAAPAASVEAPAPAATEGSVAVPRAD